MMSKTRKRPKDKRTEEDEEREEETVETMMARYDDTVVNVDLIECVIDHIVTVAFSAETNSRFLDNSCRRCPIL